MCVFLRCNRSLLLRNIIIRRVRNRPVTVFSRVKVEFQILSVILVDGQRKNHSPRENFLQTLCFEVSRCGYLGSVTDFRFHWIFWSPTICTTYKYITVISILTVLTKLFDEVSNMISISIQKIKQESIYKDPSLRVFLTLETIVFVNTLYKHCWNKYFRFVPFVRSTSSH